MIQITDMEMPKKCQWDCPFCAGDGGACLVADVETSDTERPKDCPLLPAEPCEDVLCHTNLKENAELIAKILDADACREVFLDKIKAEIESTLYVDSLIFTELMDFKAGKIDADAVIDEFNRLTKLEVLQIIGKYKSEIGGVE